MTQDSPGEDKNGGRPYRSRLLPFVDFIRGERRRRQTWAEIAAALRAKGISISTQGVHQFYRRWMIRKPSWEEEVSAKPVAVSPPSIRQPPVRSSVPPEREFRRPSLDDLTLNDPLNP
jgi:hypothetical protein